MHNLVFSYIGYINKYLLYTILIYRNFYKNFSLISQIQIGPIWMLIDHICDRLIKIKSNWQWLLRDGELTNMFELLTVPRAQVILIINAIFNSC